MLTPKCDVQAHTELLKNAFDLVRAFLWKMTSMSIHLSPSQSCAQLGCVTCAVPDERLKGWCFRGARGDAAVCV